jgi:kynurenine formamidase
MMDRVSNWGRWGDDDQIGALNLITTEKRAAAAKLITEGLVVSCAHALPKVPSPENRNPVQHMMVRGGDAGPNPMNDVDVTLDYFAIAPHGSSTTHLDALCHVGIDGTLYNNVPIAEVRSTGALRNSIMAAKDGIVSRGVLLDIPGSKGVSWLEPATPITVDDLEAAERHQGVTVEPGDVLIVATGRDARKAEHGGWVTMGPGATGAAGLHASCLPWLRERDIAVLGGDGGSDVLPSGIEGWAMPIHQLGITMIGLHLIDNMDLSRLLAACRERNRYTFHFTMAALRLEGGTASPVNPIVQM